MPCWVTSGRSCTNARHHARRGGGRHERARRLAGRAGRHGRVAQHGTSRSKRPESAWLRIGWQAPIWLCWCSMPAIPIRSRSDHFREAGRRHCAVYNKCDLMKPSALTCCGRRRRDDHQCHAGNGNRRTGARNRPSAGAQPPAAGQAVPFTAEQADCWVRFARPCWQVKFDAASLFGESGSPRDS